LTDNETITFAGTLREKIEAWRNLERLIRVAYGDESQAKAVALCAAGESATIGVPKAGDQVAYIDRAGNVALGRIESVEPADLAPPAEVAPLPGGQGPVDAFRRELVAALRKIADSKDSDMYTGAEAARWLADELAKRKEGG